MPKTLQNTSILNPFTNLPLLLLAVEVPFPLGPARPSSVL
jgi:hypothetical protein